MLQGLEVLEQMGRGQGLKAVLAHRANVLPGFDHPLAEVVRRSSDVALMLDHALQFVVSGLADVDWKRRKFDQVWSHDASVSRSALSELEALGTLLEIFPDCAPVPENPREQTPDFSIPRLLTVEVYRPRESWPESQKVEAELASQPGPLRMAISHPITGSDGLSLDFPANKVVDRILNAKREKAQVIEGIPAALYLDLRHESALGCRDVIPYRTVFSKGVHWIGTFGAWHAFYGAEGRRTMLRDRAAVRFLRPTDCHAQTRQGFFREFTQWSIAILALSDGLVFFENPWAATPVSDRTLRQLLLLHRARLEFSWFRGSETSKRLAQAVESMIDRMEWTFDTDDEEEKEDQAGP